MGAPYLRGGIPRTLGGTAPTAAPAMFEVPGGISNYFAITNLDEATNLLVWFDPPSAVPAPASFLIPAKPGSCGNPLQIPAEVGPFWVQSAGPGDILFSVIACIRRG